MPRRRRDAEHVTHIQQIRYRGDWQLGVDAGGYAYIPRIFVTVATREMATM